MEKSNTTKSDRTDDIESGDNNTYEDNTCRHCDNHPCVTVELNPVLQSILDTYRDIKTNRQIRYMMYTDSIRYIHGHSLGPDVRKKLCKR